MPITPNFAASQVIGQPSYIYFEDLSTGSDVAVVERRIYITNAAGLYLVTPTTTSIAPFYFTWAIANPTTNLNILSQDSAVTIRVDWCNISGAVLYTKTKIYGFTLYNESFYYSLTQAQASQSSPPPIIQDTNYFGNKMQLRVLVDSGNQSISLGSDLVSAQSCYNMATYMVTNQNIYF